MQRRQPPKQKVEKSKRSNAWKDSEKETEKLPKELRRIVEEYFYGPDLLAVIEALQGKRTHCRTTSLALHWVVRLCFENNNAVCLWLQYLQSLHDPYRPTHTSIQLLRDIAIGCSDPCCSCRDARRKLYELLMHVRAFADLDGTRRRSHTVFRNIVSILGVDLLLMHSIADGEKEGMQVIAHSDTGIKYWMLKRALQNTAFYVLKFRNAQAIEAWALAEQWLTEGDYGDAWTSSDSESDTEVNDVDKECRNIQQSNTSFLSVPELKEEVYLALPAEARAETYRRDARCRHNYIAFANLFHDYWGGASAKAEHLEENDDEDEPEKEQKQERGKQEERERGEGDVRVGNETTVVLPVPPGTPHIGRGKNHDQRTASLGTSQGLMKGTKGVACNFQGFLQDVPVPASLKLSKAKKRRLRKIRRNT